MEIDIQWLGKISYAEGLTLQEKYVEGVADGSLPETLLLLEHEPVFTIGRSRDDSSLKKDEALPYPTHQTNRGGQATYHGPGQLVGYPILNLRSRVQDLHRYLRFLESVLVETLKNSGISSDTRDGLTGVWVEDRKIASIGVGVRKWVTMHGFALNVTQESLPAFDRIIPCGIQGVEMTCMEKESGKALNLRDIAEQSAEFFKAMLPEEMPLAG